ncbi:MAG: hypothetical protein K6B43_00400 [Treponema sp.]|nr:hypothetical protein [Treponema sp.]
MSKNYDSDEKNVDVGGVDVSDMKTLDAEKDLKGRRQNAKKAKRGSVGGKIFRFFLLLVVLAIAAGLAFCAFDRKSAISSIPNSFSFYVKTSSAIDTIDPILDLRAADVFLSTPEFKGFRSLFMDLRSSPIRKNWVFRKLAARPVDAALYDGAIESGKQNFIAAVNFGWMSFISRNFKAVYPKIFPFIKKILYENKAEIKIVDDENLSYFELKLDGEMYYFVPAKNLVIFSDSKELLMMSAVVANDITYTEPQKKLILQKAKEFRIIANARKLAETFTSQNDVTGNVAALLPENELSVVALKFSDTDISIDMKVPVSLNDEKTAALRNVFAKKSTTPEILSRMTDIVQYYTILNIGTLEELQKGVFPILPVKNPDAMWNSANTACRFALSMDISDLIFSWSGKELAVLGIENQNDPVFAVQVADEKKRQEVFDKVADSFFVNSDNSLILDGVRLPRLKLPSFLNGILSLFGVSIPKPYYMVLDDFIYFSESPEALSAIFMENDSGNSLLKIDSWKTVSSGLKNDVAVSLFYNLDRSIPFFIRSNVSVSQVLELYTMGRFDVRIKDDEINFVLQANSSMSKNLRAVPGFPIELDKSAVVQSFVVENEQSPRFAFWTEKNSIKRIDLSSLEMKGVEDVGKCELAQVGAKVKNGALWAVSSDGYVYLFDRNLSALENFPVVLPERTVSGISSCDDGILVPLENGSIALVRPNGTVSTIKMPEISIKSSPNVLGNIASVYDKSFLGAIYFADLKNLSCMNEENPLNLYEIGFGSPVSLSADKKIYTAFVSQAGTLFIWEDFSGEPVVQKDISGGAELAYGTFEGRICASSKYFYALSSNAVLFRIGVDGEVLSVKIPNATAKDAFISVKKTEKFGEERVFVNADSNIIYGFNEKLELLPGFPLVGSGNPFFADVDGDKKNEILSISLDKKITAWKLR